jgi:hypothetical protein
MVLSLRDTEKPLAVLPCRVFHFFGAEAFDLGDLVTCNATRYGVRFDARITEFEETFEQGFRKVYITMGKPTITYAKAILAQAKKGKVK